MKIRNHINIFINFNKIELFAINDRELLKNQIYYFINNYRSLKKQ